MSDIEIKTEEPEVNDQSLLIREIKQHNQLKMGVQATINAKTTTITPIQSTASDKSAFEPHHQKCVAPPIPFVKPKAYMAGNRCGEIFVSNNARQWTFICTFCNKNTRDIGDFICHIKMRHLVDPADSCSADSSGTDEDYYGQEKDVSKYYATISTRGGRNVRLRSSKAVEIIPINYEYAYEQRNAYHPTPSIPPLPPKHTTGASILEPVSQRQPTTVAASSEYLDCSSYLDVNVHTESEELSYNGQEHNSKKSTWSRLIPSPTPFRPKYKTNNNKKRKAVSKDENMTQLTHGDDKNDADNEGEKYIKHTGKRAEACASPVGEKKTALINGDISEKGLDSEDYNKTDDQYSQQGDNGMDALNDNTNFEDEDEEDFDNQLLIAPGGDSIDATSSSNEIKAKRRQIRGTAYCALCNKTFQYYSLYRNHMIKHSDETPFKCILCKKGFKSKQAIRYHMHTHQKEKRYKCSLCLASYYTENQFVTHLLTHENATTFPCMVCAKILRSEKERSVHLTAHEEERPYRCEFCKKLFRLRHHLSNHLKMHRQYRCDYCKAEFTSDIHLRKPYACKNCESLPDVKEHRNTKPVTGSSGTAGEEPIEINPVQLLETIAPPQQPVQCTDVAEMVTESEEEDEEEDDDASPVYTPYSSSKKRFNCKFCPRSYSHLSGLNYHIRNKHY